MMQARKHLRPKKRVISRELAGLRTNTTAPTELTASEGTHQTGRRNPLNNHTVTRPHFQDVVEATYPPQFRY